MDNPHRVPYAIDPSLPRGTCRLVHQGDGVVIAVDSVDTAQALVLAIGDWLLHTAKRPNGDQPMGAAR